MKVYTGKHLRRPDSLFLSSPRSQVLKGTQVGAHVVEIAPTSHTRFPFPRISSPNNSTAIQKQNLTLTMTSLVTVSVQTGVILIAALKFIRKLHLCNAKKGISNWLKFILPFRQKTPTQYLPIMPKLSPKLSFINIIYSTKGELCLMNIQISMRPLY